MTTEAFTKSPSKTLAIVMVAATVLATSLVSGAQAGNGGGGGSGGGDRDQRSSFTMTNPDGSSATASSRKRSKRYSITKRNKFGKVTSRKRKNKPKKRVKIKLRKRVKVKRVAKKRKPSWVKWTDSRGTHMRGRDSRGGFFSITLHPIR